MSSHLLFFSFFNNIYKGCPWKHRARKKKKKKKKKKKLKSESRPHCHSWYGRKLHTNFNDSKINIFRILGSSSRWGLIIAPDQEPEGENFGLDNVM